LAAIYDEQGKYDKAEHLYTREISMLESIYKGHVGRNDWLGREIHKLADLYRVQGKYAEAQPLYERSLEEIWPEHPIDLINLGRLYKARGKYAEAEPLYNRAQALLESELAKRKKSREPKHPLVAQSLENFADQLRDAELYEEADEMEARAKAIRDRYTSRNPTK